MKKVVFIQPKILEYRRDFYNLLSERSIEVTVFHSSNTKFTNENDYFNDVLIDKVALGRFTYYKVGDLSGYDRIIYPLDIYCLNSLFSLIKRNEKVVFWGIGKGRVSILSSLRKYMSKKYDTILYSNETLASFFCNSRRRLISCNNTVSVVSSEFNLRKKKNVIFVGSLDKRKELDRVIVAFKNALPLLEKDQNLIIVGDGVEMERLRSLVKHLNMDSRVNFKGRVTSNSILKEYYETSLLNVSYGQCGLTALQSCGFGVPVVAKEGAITGGEMSIIVNDYTGRVINGSLSALTGALVDFLTKRIDPESTYYNCLKMYDENYSLNSMVDVFADSIKLEKEIDL
ncbi:hypothetical protein BCT04_16800 [Vibrio breoganii]|uniref:glycosyltransferase n=1 Tax=Vibrio breoganii TaxID=553239 RepID=UPI000C83CE54|nr:glycosyltransferase [Vibrio breoganii]PMO62221.1 hypothetical protein BCT04_16800 [Vibrio breoganii]